MCTHIQIFMYTNTYTHTGVLYICVHANTQTHAHTGTFTCRKRVCTKTKQQKQTRRVPMLTLVCQLYYVQITCWGGAGSHSRHRPHPCLTKAACRPYLPPASIPALKRSFPTHSCCSCCQANKHTSVPALARLCVSLRPEPGHPQF